MITAGKGNCCTFEAFLDARFNILFIKDNFGMRAYTITAAAFALKVPPKWLDNVITHHEVPGVFRKRQGVSRRLTPQAILTLDLALRLSRSLGSPLPVAIRIAQAMVASRNEPAHLLDHGISLQADIERIEKRLSELLGHAVEFAPIPRRGRPPSRK